MNFFDPSQLGFWVLVLPVIALTAQLVATLLLRKKRIRLLSLADEILSRPGATKADRAWVAMELRSSLDRSFLWIAALGMPFLAIMAFILSLRDAHASDDETPEELIVRLDADIERLKSEAFRLQTDMNTDDAKYWHSEERHEMSDLAHTIQMWNSPVALAWLFVGLVPAAMLTLLSIALLAPAKLAAKSARRLFEGTSASILDRLRLALA